MISENGSLFLSDTLTLGQNFVHADAVELRDDVLVTSPSKGCKNQRDACVKTPMPILPQHSRKL